MGQLVSICGAHSDQSEDPTWKQYVATVGHLDSKLCVDCNGILVKHFLINDAIRTVVLKSFQARLLYLDQHPSTAGDPGQLKMHDSMCLKYH